MHVTYTSATYLVSRLLLHTTVLACDAQVPALIREERGVIVLKNNAAGKKVSEEYHSHTIRLIKPAHNDEQAGLYTPVMVDAHGNH